MSLLSSSFDDDYAKYDKLRQLLHQEQNEWSASNHSSTSSSSSYISPFFIPLVTANNEIYNSNYNIDNEEAANTAGRNLHYIPETKEILCHVPIMFRWTSGTAETGYSDVSSESYGGSVAAALAMHHFNTGNPSIIDELVGLPQKCPIRMTMELLNSYSSGQRAMQQLTELLTRHPNSITHPQPCAMLGSSWSSVTKTLATVTGVYDIPHTTSSASSVDLDDAGEYPLFTRTHPSDASMARLSMDYLKTQLNVDFVGVLYLDNAFGNAYNEVLLKVAADPKYHMTIQSQSFRSGATDDEIRLALQRLADTQYRYFLGVFFGADYERIMTIAYELGIAGPGKFWMFNGALAAQFINGVTKLPKDSPAALATYGNAILSDEGGLPGVNVHHDRFLREWKSMEDGFLDYIHSKQPVPPTPSSNPEGEPISFNRTREFFTAFDPSHIAAFSYDAVISIGLAACDAYQEVLQKQLQEEESATSSKTRSSLSSTSTPSVPKIFSGAEHHSKMITKYFSGASGSVVIGPDTFSRKAESTVHVVSNILPIDEVNEDIVSDDGHTTSTTISVLYKGDPLSVFDTSSQQWTDYSGNAFIYADGTFLPPLQIPLLVEERNTISTPVRAVCLTLSGIAMMLSIGFFVYCCVFQRNHRVIRASQPIFLAMICGGSLLMASSIIPASLDDAVIASTRGCDIACVAKFWLFPMGFCIVFAALFSKLWRINILLSQSARFQRIRVETRDVMIPFVVLLTLNVALLSSWTAIDPPYWSRDPPLEYDDFGRVNKSTGRCTSDHMVAFVLPLFALNGCALLLALWQAYVCRNVSTDFSESKYIAMATVCIFQALFMGAPIMFIVEDQPTALLFVYTGIVVVVCFSILLLMFVPKIQAIHKTDVSTTRTSAFQSAIATSGYYTNGKGGTGGARVSMSGHVIPSQYNNAGNGIAGAGVGAGQIMASSVNSFSDSWGGETGGYRSSDDDSFVIGEGGQQQNNRRNHHQYFHDSSHGQLHMLPEGEEQSQELSKIVVTNRMEQSPLPQPSPGTKITRVSSSSDDFQLSFEESSYEEPLNQQSQVEGDEKEDDEGQSQQVDKEYKKKEDDPEQPVKKEQRVSFFAHIKN